MKRILFTIMAVALLSCNAHAANYTIDSLVTADDTTITWINNFKNTVTNALNNFPGTNLNDSSIESRKLDNNANPEYRWGEAFNEFVYTGLLAPTAAGLATTTTAGTAYIREDSTLKMKRVVKDAVAYTYTASKDTYVDLKSDGTYVYQAVANGAAAPSTTANAIRLFKVVTNATDVTSVSDLRVTGVQISTNEDYYKKGLEIYWGNGSIISADAGVAYVGATRVKKSSFVSLNIDTATDYINGASEKGAGSKFLYVYIDSSGNVKLDDDAPGHADTEGNTQGVKRYFKNGSAYWRCLGAVYLNATPHVERFFQRGNKFTYDDSWFNDTVRVLNGGAATSFTAVSCAGVVPAFARMVGINAHQGGAGGTLNIRAPGSATYGVWQVVVDSANLNDYQSSPDIPTSQSQVIEYKVNANTMTLWVRDYTVDLFD